MWRDAGGFGQYHQNLQPTPQTSVLSLLPWCRFSDDGGYGGGFGGRWGGGRGSDSDAEDMERELMCQVGGACAAQPGLPYRSRCCKCARRSFGPPPPPYPQGIKPWEYNEAQAALDVLYDYDDYY